MAPEIQNQDVYKNISNTLGKALSNIKQKGFGGNLDGFSFRGTNTILEGNRIIFIKDNSPEEWSDRAAKNDVSRVMPKGGMS